MDKRIKNILRCYAAGMGIKETASTFHTSRNTIRKGSACSFLKAGKASNSFASLPDGQSWMSRSAAQSPGIGSPASKSAIELEALLPRICIPLRHAKVWSVRKLFKEYHTEYPDSYQLSSFKRVIREYGFHIKVVGHVASTMPQTGCILTLPVTA